MAGPDLELLGGCARPVDFPRPGVFKRGTIQPESPMTHCILIGAPVDEGQRRPGCLMGPAAYRVAGLARAIADLGHGVEDWGDLTLPDLVDTLAASAFPMGLLTRIPRSEALRKPRRFMKLNGLLICVDIPLS